LGRTLIGSFEDVKELSKTIMDEVKSVIVGKEEAIEGLLIALLSGGHVLLEGPPGVAKTYMAKAFSMTLGCTFKRIQFTPDLLPADIIGTNVYNQQKGVFEFIPGPVFANIILADEINRAPPRTQAALLECMQEKQVTVEGKTHSLPKPFMVIATQNPIELEGTYPLPEAQLDRFLFKLPVDYPVIEEEVEILQRKSILEDPEEITVRPVVNPTIIVEMSRWATKVYVDKKVMDYIAEIVTSIRKSRYISYGASPRASIALMLASRARAAIHGRNYIEPDDVKILAPFVLSHRIILTPEAELEGVTPMQVISEVINRVPVPAEIQA